MLLAVHHNPAIVRAAVCRAMRVVNARRESVRVAEEGLPVSEDLRVRRRSYHSIQIVVGYHFDQLIAAIRKLSEHRMHVMAAVRPRGLIAGMPRGHAADHHVIHVVHRSGGDQASELGIHIRRASRRKLRRWAKRSCYGREQGNEK